MRKKAKKLALAKETVRSLVDRELIAAQVRTGTDTGLWTYNPEETCAHLFNSERNC